MENEFRNKCSLLLEIYDIKGLQKELPKKKIGVNVNRIYIQIAKYNCNPNRVTEIQILKKALLNVSNKNHFDSRYATMNLEDVIKCFGANLNKLPKTTFVQSYIFDSDNDE